MVTFACAVVAYLRALFLPRHKLALEAVALRQQLAVFKRKQPRLKLDRFDRLFWIVLRRLWHGWSEALIIVKPETVVSWHRAGDSDCFGGGSPRDVDQGDQKCMRRSAS